MFKVKDRVKEIGIWLDHRQAYVIILENGLVAVERLESNVMSQLRVSGGPVRGRQDAKAEAKPDRRKEQELRRYYVRLVEMVKDVSALFIMGPGEAPGELERFMYKNYFFDRRLKGVEEMDKMTEPQLVQQVKRFFYENIIND